MKEEKDLSKHPIKYAIEYVRGLLEIESKVEVIEKLTFTVRESTIIVTCTDMEIYKVLKKCEKKVDEKFIEELGMKAIRFQCDRYYIILNILKKYVKEGRKEFKLEEMVEEVNKYEPARTPQAVRDILAFYATEYPEYWKSAGYNYPEELMQARGLNPLISRQKKGVYQILIKKGKFPKPKLPPKIDFDSIFSDF
jgi:hypothetical protein